MKKKISIKDWVANYDVTKKEANQSHWEEYSLTVKRKYRKLELRKKQIEVKNWVKNYK